MIVYLARHAETNFNVLGWSNSDPTVDVHLTEKGITQAQELARALLQDPISVIFTSGLPRTFETAQYIAEGRRVAIIQDTRIDDIHMGYEGEPVAKYHAALSAEPDIWAAKFNDGESMNELLLRIDDFIQDLYRQKATYTTVLIVSHFTVLQLIIARIKNIDKQDALAIEVTQGGFTRLEL